MRRSRTMGRAGLRQRLGVGFDRHRPLSWGSPRELKKKARPGYRYLVSRFRNTCNKQTIVANGVRPLEFDLRRGEAFFVTGSPGGGRDETTVSDSGRCRILVASRSPSLRPIPCGSALESDQGINSNKARCYGLRICALTHAVCRASPWHA